MANRQNQQVQQQLFRNIFLSIKAHEAVTELKDIKGLKDFQVLDDYDRIVLSELEGKNNHGIGLCLNRDVVLLFTHDSNFRNAPYPIVYQTKSSIIFPPAPFPELENKERKNIVSASPSQQIHFYLANKYNLDVTQEDATLLIGFDVE